MTAPANLKMLSLPAQGWLSLYPYTADLICLDGARPLGRNPIPELLSSVSTPLVTQKWAYALQNHPDQAYVNYILEGLEHGFRKGFNRNSRLNSAKSNMQSAILHPKVITEYLQKEIKLGRMIGPISEKSTVGSLLHINRFGVIPKGHNTAWKVVIDYRPILSCRPQC